MKTVRLNEKMRQDILTRLMRHGFQESEEEIARLHGELAAEVYEDIYPSFVQLTMGRLPAGFFDTNTSLRVNLGGQVALFAYRNRPIAHCHTLYNSTSKSYSADHPFSLRHGEIDARHRALVEEMMSARQQAKSVLDSCATCRQLLEVWPDVEPFVRDFMKSPSPQSVALTVSAEDLKRQFNLKR